jgi:glycosyltransferase involved in cell wall biosynthesis
MFFDRAQRAGEKGAGEPFGDQSQQQIPGTHNIGSIETSGRTTSVTVPPKLSVVVPVFNERATIGEIVRRIQAVDIEKEILIVDDGSTDGTREFLRDWVGRCSSKAGVMTLPGGSSDFRADNIRVFFQETNCGKGAAVRRGFKEARGRIVIIQDADLEYDPQDFFRLIEPIDRGEADVVYGSRFLGGGPHRVLFFWHYVGNRFLTTLSDMSTNLNLSDVWTCYKVFRREVLERIDLQENRFGFEQEITVKISRNRWRVYEVPISYYGRTYAQGKKINWKDGVRGLWCILYYSLKAGRSDARTP